MLPSIARNQRSSPQPEPVGGSGAGPASIPKSGKVALARKLYADKSNSIADICKTLHISRATSYRYVKETRARKPYLISIHSVPLIRGCTYCPKALPPGICRLNLKGRRGYGHTSR
ncbi:MAG: helix-turn-helix domain-containing protein [Alphaproteobacteria bacterium]|nr:helix-turn-helix domain-containing protein [Alphaproteobacteria bacterium]